ncbi:MAG TPA: trypsin-like peptidase domain-containing protein, partial [Bacillota bacterium]|nr:trypsin-like peptidase domain-containing protein [Bacillota bacterium]
ESEVWSATSFCDQLVVECQVPPGVDPRSVAFTLSGFSHIYTLPRIGGNEKAAGSCNNDVSCYPADAQVALGVARIAFVDAGSTYLCTGCLLAGADPNNSANFFLTANHCVGSQSVASTLELFWFYQTSTCNGAPPSLAGVPMTGGGADLLATATGSDYALLQLRQSPPQGTFSLGWSLTPPSSSETLTSIHHPSGSFKRISFGHLIASDAGFWAVQWSSGVTEPGSSGCPLLNANLQVIGQLNGGYGGPGSSCASPSAPDQYGRFDVSYSGMQSWLGGGGGPIVMPVKGTYRGLFADGGNGVSAQSAGAVALTTTAKGKFSGSLVLGAGRYAYRGQFDASGSAQVTIPRRSLAPLSVQLQVDAADADHLTGSVSDGSFNASLSADRAVYDGRFNSAPQAGRYTLILPGNYSSADQPGGDSFGVLTVSKAGLVQFSAALADGMNVSQAAMVSKNGQWPLYLPLYGGKGLLFGWVDFASSGASDLSGTVTWIRPSMSRAKLYAAGFTSLTTAAGSRYTPPPAGVSILNLPSGQVTLSGANLDPSIVNQIALGNNNRVTNMSENRLNLLFVLPTGTFRGGVMNPQTAKAVAFRGVVLQKQNIAAGFFMNIDQSGQVMIAAPQP